MFCKHCGKEIDDIATFCGYCGNTVAAVAPANPVEAQRKSKAPVIIVAVVSAIVVIGASIGLFLLKPWETKSLQDGKSDEITQTGEDNTIIASIPATEPDIGEEDIENYTVIIPYEYDYIDYFSEDLAIFGVGDYYNMKYGLIDKAGNEVAAPEYDYISSNKNNNNAAIIGIGDASRGTGDWDSSNMKYGLIDLNGNEIVAPKYNSMYGFSDGVMVVGIGTSWESMKFGLIDFNGNEITSIIYDEIGNLSGGLARVRNNNRYGFINVYGNEVLPCIYYDATGFSESDKVAYVKIDSGNRGWYYINTSGDILTQISYSDYDFMGDFEDGVAIVGTGNWENMKYGLINIKGDEITPLRYDYIGNYYDGFAIIGIIERENAKYGLIDKNGNEIIAPKYDSIYKVSDDIAMIGIGSNWESMKYGLIDLKGNEIVAPKYNVLYPMSGGGAIIGIGNWESMKYGLIDKYGNEVITPKYDSMWERWESSDGTVVAGTGISWNVIRYGLVNANGRVIVPIEFNEIGSGLFGSDNYYAVRADDKWGVISVSKP